MLRNYLKIAIRNLLKNKAFSAINIFGLAISMTVCFIILQYVVHERSYDEFHEHAERIYRVPMVKYEPNEAPQTFAFTFPAVGPNLRKDFPEIEEMIRIRRSGGITRYKDEQYVEQGVFYVDSSFFKLFSFPVLKGNPDEALSQPGKGMISESTARKYFGNEDPMGKLLEVSSNSFEVAGVFADVPDNSHMQFDILISYSTYRQIVASFGGDAENSWTWSDFYTYILLEQGAESEQLQPKLPGFMAQYKGADMEEKNYRIELILQPLRDIHLHSDLGYEMQVNGNARYVSLLILIAIFVLIIAWVNYINLSTARSIDRAREVGVRKVVGAQKSQLIRQFLLESALINLLAIGIALFLAKLLLPSFGLLAGRELSFSVLQSSWFWLGLLALFIGGTLLSGLYPAFVLSSHKPITVLRSGAASKSGSTELLRKGLVVLQYAASVALIAGSLTVYRQLQFARHQDLGIDINQTLVLNDYGRSDTSMISKVQSLKDELEQYSDIISVSASGDIPGKEVGNSWNLRWTNSSSPAYKRCRTFAVDAGYLDQYGMEVIAGRQFSNDYGAEQNNIVLNETAVNVFGFESPEAALSEQIVSPNGSISGRVVGIVKDYHQESLKYAYKPIAFYLGQANWNYYSLKISSDDLPSTLETVETAWKRRFPEKPFAYFFLDEFFNQQYQADIRFGYLFGLFTILAIIIASLGLFGLSSYSMARRYKEIGIRKVLGASVQQILMLLSKDYLFLMIIAGAVALPAAYWSMQKWLMNYAYTIKLSWWFFILPLVIVLLITSITVSYQSARAALSNPVDAIKDE